MFALVEDIIRLIQAVRASRGQSYTCLTFPNFPFPNVISELPILRLQIIIYFFGFVTFAYSDASSSDYDEEERKSKKRRVASPRRGGPDGKTLVMLEPMSCIVPLGDLARLEVSSKFCWP